MKLLLQRAAPFGSVVYRVSYYNNNRNRHQNQVLTLLILDPGFNQYLNSMFKIIRVFNLHSSDYSIV